MSPRAACRLEALGFEQVYDYVPGKADWLARGLPREGEKADEGRVVDVLRTDVVTARPAERVSEVRARVAGSRHGFAFVVSADGTLLGRLRQATLDGEPDARAEDVMEPGPSTVRADVPQYEMRDRLDKLELKTAVVTTPDGILLGIVHRDDLA